MSIGWDVSELLVELTTKNERIALLEKDALTWQEVLLIVDTVSDAYAPGLPPVAASVCRKMQTLLAAFEVEKKAREKFVDSLTEEEMDLILARRKK